VYTKKADGPVPGFRKYWTQKLASLKYEYHAILSKYPEAASVIQQVYKVLGDIENLAGCTPAEVGESSEWTSTVNTAEEKRTNICKALDGKPLCSTLYGMYTVTLTELKAVLKVCTDRTKWCSEQNFSGINGPGRRFPGSKGTQEAYL
jgi:hypothetical protein